MFHLLNCVVSTLCMNNTVMWDVISDIIVEMKSTLFLHNLEL